MASDKLTLMMELAAEEDRLIKYPVEIKGRDFTYWAKPMTIKDYNKAKRAAKNPDDALESSIRLFIGRARDEHGNLQCGIDAVPVMLNILDMNSVAKLLNAEPAEDMEVGKLDMKVLAKQLASS